MAKLKNRYKSKEDLIKYCDFLITKKHEKDDDEFDRGYRYGIQHIKDQIKKSIFRWD